MVYLPRLAVVLNSDCKLETPGMHFKNTNPQSIPLEQLNQNCWMYGLGIISLKIFAGDSNIQCGLRLTTVAPDQPEVFPDFVGTLVWLLENTSPKLTDGKKISCVTNN